MSLTFTVLLGVLCFVVLLLIIAAFVKKEYSVERDIIISKPKGIVFDYLKRLKNQDNFSKWALMDPNMKKEYRGIDGTPGFVSAWDSTEKNVGKGEQEIKRITEGDRIDYEIRFIKPFAGVANAYLKTTSLPNNRTMVAWGFDSSMKYPMNLMLLFMNMEKMVGKDFETGLLNLKTLLEK